MPTTETLRVLELGTGFASAYAARLLADQGADVVKVEPPEGDPARRLGPFADAVDEERSGLFLAVNLNKRGVCLDLETDDDRDRLARLVAWASIVVHSLRRDEAAALGLDPASVHASRPDLVVLAMTPFGLSGPYADFTASELTLSHGGGWAGLCPMAHPEPSYPPLKMHGHHCSMMAGVAGAMTVFALVRDRARCGVGEYVDFSVLAYVASVLEFGIHVYTYHGFVIKRTVPRSLIPWRIFDTKDGAIFLACIEQDQWERLVEFMGNPEWATLEVFATPAGRNQNQDVIHTFLEEFIGGWNTFDLYHAAQQKRICFAPVMTFENLATDRHLADRRFFTTLAGDETRYLAPALLIDDERPQYRRPAPRLGEHNDEMGTAAPQTVPPATAAPCRPLEGVRVLDLTWVWAGPFGSMNLAHLGADVIRVESSVRPDLYRRGPAAPEGVEPSLNTNGMFNQWNQGKRSVGVDLRDPSGIEIVKALVAEVDVVFQNFATGVLERLGLSYEVLKAINPRVILASVSGYGQTGPYREYMGYGPATGPLSGLASASGFPGEGPEETGVAMPDPTAGITAAYAVTAALLRRDETGVGEHLDVTLWEATAALNLDGWMEYALRGTQAERIGNRDPWMAPHGCFPAAGDDEWVTIACTDEGFPKLAEIVPGLNDERFASLASRKQHEGDLESVLSAWTSKLDRWYVTGLLQAQGIAAFPSFTAKDIIEDPHLNARGFVERLEHPEVGARAHTGIPWRFAERPNGVRMPAPQLGGHTDEVLRDVLGLGGAEIDDLRGRGVLT
ncbi:MAG: CoA transferase [Gammaproteobacteria bacterium]|nr:CoA transferase [Gammaproteobacteria bacterium]